MPKPLALSNSTIFGLIVVHLAIALPLAYSLNIWADEASSLYTTEQGFLSAFQNAAANEKQAPLYFWVLSLWRAVDGSVFFARLFSVICSAIAIAVFARFVSRNFSPRAALLASAFFALHPFLFWASLEIRGYSLTILLAIILFGSFFDGFLNEGKLSSHITFVVAAIISLYTNYYLGFLLAGFFFALIFTKHWKALRKLLLSMAVTTVAFSPLLAANAPSQISARIGGFHESVSALEAIRMLWHHAITFLLPAELIRGEESSNFTVFRTWIVRAVLVFLVALVIKNRSKVRERAQIIAIVTIVSSACLFAVALFVSPSYTALRHSTPLFVPFVLFVSALCVDVFNEIDERATKIVTFVVGLIVLASFSYSITTMYPNQAKRGDWARIGAFLEQNESPGQPIIIFTTFDALALPYHYRGVNKILPDEKFFEFTQEAAFGTEASLQKQTEFVISEIPTDAERIWLATNEKCLVGQACAPLENFIRANYTIEIEKDFYLEKLYLLKRRR